MVKGVEYTRKNTVVKQGKRRKEMEKKVGREKRKRRMWRGEKEGLR